MSMALRNVRKSFTGKAAVDRITVHRALAEHVGPRQRSMASEGDEDVQGRALRTRRRGAENARHRAAGRPLSVRDFGRQQQRVAIVRTIAPKPSMLLFDEPLSNLGAKLRFEMRTELIRFHRTTVYVNHDQIEAMTMESHVAVMNHGRVQKFGTPGALVDHPETAFVGTSANNMASVVKNGSRDKLGRGHMPVPPPAEDCMAVSRAERMSPAEAEGTTTLSMALVETNAIAGRTMVTDLREVLRLTAIIDRGPAGRIGDTIQFRLPGRHDSWFGPDGERTH